VNFQLHEEFKEGLIRKEFEITEFNQKLEKLSLDYSEQLDEINKNNEIIFKKKRENETKEEMLTNETSNLKKRTEGVSDCSEKTTLKINESINYLKTLDEKKKNLEKDFTNIQKEREDITYEFEKKQNYLSEVLSKINQISISIKNYQNQQKQEKINTDNRRSTETGNKQLDMLLKEKMKIQRNEENLNTKNYTYDETTIIINPSKIFKEVNREPLLDRTNISRNSISSSQSEKNSLFKRFVMYMGSKIFIKE
jgi:hypothetical protein